MKNIAHVVGILPSFGVRIDKLFMLPSTSAKYPSATKHTLLLNTKPNLLNRMLLKAFCRLHFCRAILFVAPMASVGTLLQVVQDTWQDDRPAPVDLLTAAVDMQTDGIFIKPSVLQKNFVRHEVLVLCVVSAWCHVMCNERMEFVI